MGAKEGGKDDVEAKPDGSSGGPPAITDTTAEFEEYTAPPRVDAQGRPIAKAKGLKAAGYQFPPPGGPQPPLTKANLAKGIGVPEVPRATAPSKPDWKAAPRGPADDDPHTAAAKPSAVKVDEGDLFEEYQRPDLKDRPRTGKGIRSEPPPAPGEPGGPTAKDILAKLPEPELQVFTPKRFSPYQVKTGEESRATHAADHERAALDAAADLAVHRKWLEAATMSNPAAGPLKAVIHDDHPDEAAAPPEPTPSPLPSARPWDTKAAEFVAPPSKPPEAQAKPTEARLAEAIPPEQKPQAKPIPEPTAMDATLPDNAALATAPPTTMSSAMVIQPPRPTSTPYVPPPRATYAPAPSSHPSGAVSSVQTGGHSSGAPPTPAGGDVPRIGLVQSDFHYDITTRMAQAAHEKARMLGTSIAHHVHVPGAFDIPLAAQALLERGDVDAVVVVGAIVKGETGHDVLIARECARKLADLAVALRKPVGFGVTGPEMTRDQAWARIGAGANAVESVVRQHRVVNQLRT